VSAPGRILATSALAGLALQREPPALIVDASPATLDVPPLDRAARDAWTLQEPKDTVLSELDRLFRWIEEHHVRVTEVGSLHWPVYEPRRGVSSDGGS